MTDSYSHDMIRSHEIRSLGALLFLVSRVQARVDRQLAVVWLRRGAATAFAHRGCIPVSYRHLRAHETREDLVCRLLLEKKTLFAARLLIESVSAGSDA